MRVGLTYDLRSDYLALGLSLEETAEFDKEETVAGIEGALRELGHVAEGATTAIEVAVLARELGVEMPITAAVAQILKQEIPPREAVAALLARNLKDEGA